MPGTVVVLWNKKSFNFNNLTAGTTESHVAVKVVASEKYREGLLIIRAHTRDIVNAASKIEVAAIRRAKSCAELRRGPAQGDHDRELPTTDREGRALDILQGVLHRAGLTHPHAREAIRMRLIGMTDEGAAHLSVISPGRFRARVGAGLHELGIEDAYGIPRVLATQLAADLDAIAAMQGTSAAAVLAQFESALARKRCG